MLKKIFLLSFLMSICAVLTLAQDEEKMMFDDSSLPRTADSAEKFVPSGWMIEETISGDLNNDTAADIALALIEKPEANADKDANESRERVLMILFKTPKGELERVATATDLLQCTQCGGMLGGNTSAAEIKIAKGVLIVNSLSGSRESTETTYRFRYDAKIKKLALIGYDSIERDRGTGESTSQSTNFLTGVQVTEEFQYSEKLDKDVKKSTQRKKVNKPTQYFENINYAVLDNE